ncbi:MAG TPA: hypothetical protein VM099_03310 [Gemmatimonadaceae bacterium]|nr:hypothetical protein [Gemmatimonadaceae bacterium]
MTPPRLAGLLLVCIAFFAPEARGQGTPRSALARALAKFPPTEPLRIGAESGLFEGRVDTIVSDTLHLRTQTSGIVALPTRSVRNVWVKRSVRSEAAGIGGMMGAIIGAGVGIIPRNSDGVCAPPACTEHTKTKLAVYTITGGLAGGLIGLVGGGMYRHWSQIFPD